jgi:hypothetical protein
VLVAVLVGVGVGVGQVCEQVPVVAIPKVYGWVMSIHVGKLYVPPGSTEAP